MRRQCGNARGSAYAAAASAMLRVGCAEKREDEDGQAAMARGETIMPLHYGEAGCCSQAAIGVASGGGRRQVPAFLLSKTKAGLRQQRW